LHASSSLAPGIYLNLLLPTRFSLALLSRSSGVPAPDISGTTAGQKITGQTPSGRFVDVDLSGFHFLLPLIIMSD
jgi:hypothetical protein